MKQSVRVGFVGLGDMGGAIAERIIAAGFPTTLWARREASLEPFPRAARAVDLPALGRASDVVGICVFNDDDVRQVLLGANGILAGMAEGGVVLIHSTISVEACAEFAAAGAARGVAVLDAPVSGAREGALAGRLAIMLGGDRAAYEKALPVMQAYGSNIRLMGPLGSGQKMKVLNNVVTFCNGSIARLAIEIGGRLGLDQPAVIDMLRHSSGRSFALEALVEKLMGDPAFTAHAQTMIVKDTNLFKQVCRDAGIPPTLLEQVAEHRAGVSA